MLASLNSLLGFLGWEDCWVKSLKTQRQTYSPEEKELTRAEYLRLLKAAKDRPQLMYKSSRNLGHTRHFFSI